MMGQGGRRERGEKVLLFLAGSSRKGLSKGSQRRRGWEERSGKGRVFASKARAFGKRKSERADRRGEEGETSTGQRNVEARRGAKGRAKKVIFLFNSVSYISRHTKLL
jgi:hypothetical protein